MYSELNFETEYRENVYKLFSLEDSFFCFGHLEFRGLKRRDDYKQKREELFYRVLTLTCKSFSISTSKVCVVLKHEITNRYNIKKANGHIHFLISDYKLKDLDKDKFIKKFKTLWKENVGDCVIERFDYERKEQGLNYTAKVKKNGEKVHDGIKISRAMKRRFKWLTRHSVNGPRMPSKGF
tara:strand:- start:166 stop:708 length:543 start_codon:yes stop_codon:yes gene_type:complete